MNFWALKEIAKKLCHFTVMHLNVTMQDVVKFHSFLTAAVVPLF